MIWPMLLWVSKLRLQYRGSIDVLYTVFKMNMNTRNTRNTRNVLDEDVILNHIDKINTSENIDTKIDHIILLYQLWMENKGYLKERPYLHLMVDKKAKELIGELSKNVLTVWFFKQKKVNNILHRWIDCHSFNPKYAPKLIFFRSAF